MSRENLHRKFVAYFCWEKIISRPLHNQHHHTIH